MSNLIKGLGGHLRRGEQHLCGGCARCCGADCGECGLGTGATVRARCNCSCYADSRIAVKVPVNTGRYRILYCCGAVITCRPAPPAIFCGSPGAYLKWNAYDETGLNCLLPRKWHVVFGVGRGVALVTQWQYAPGSWQLTSGGYDTAAAAEQASQGQYVDVDVPEDGSYVWLFYSDDYCHDNDGCIKYCVRML